MDTLYTIVVYTLLSAIGVGAVLAVLLALLEPTGPFCPGMDPSYLGYCEKELGDE